jgi:hypothetical protein
MRKLWRRLGGQVDHYLISLALRNLEAEIRRQASWELPSVEFEI